MARPTVVADAERDGHAAGDVAPVSPLAKLDALVAPSDTAALAEIAVLWVGIEHGRRSFAVDRYHVVAASIAFRFVSFIVRLWRMAWSQGQRRRPFVALADTVRSIGGSEMWFRRVKKRFQSCFVA
jgi:hypothetical protein